MRFMNGPGTTGKKNTDNKLFAEMAFYDNTERYNQFYASDVRRNAGKDATPKPAAQ